MSIRVMTDVWDSGLYKGGTLLVLLALADWAQDDGTRVYPGLRKLADKSRLSVRGAQEALEKLKEDGVIVAVENETGGRGKVTHYRIVLERVQKVHALASDPKGCTSARERVKSAAEKGAVSDAKGELSDAHIDNHQEPSKEPSLPTNARTRATGERWASPGSEEETQKPPKRRYSDPFERIWTEILKWPGFNRDIVSKPEIFAAFREVEAEMPPTGDVVAAARAYGQGIARENAGRPKNDQRRLHHPANWFRNKHWLRDDIPIASVDEPVRPRTIAKDHVERLRAAGMDDALIAQWFGDGEFDEGPPPIFRAASAFKGDWIAQRFGAQLERAFGAKVLVTVKQERAA